MISGTICLSCPVRRPGGARSGATVCDDVRELAVMLELVGNRRQLALLLPELLLPLLLKVRGSDG